MIYLERTARSLAKLVFFSAIALFAAASWADVFPFGSVAYLCGSLCRVGSISANSSSSWW